MPAASAPESQQDSPLPRLGIIAGSGDLPLRIVEACLKSNREIFVLAFHEETSEATVANAPHHWLKVADIANTIELLHKVGVQEVVMAGKISRPSLSSLRPTLGTTRLIARLGKSLLSGDDALFKAIVSYFEDMGFRVVGTDDILQDVVTSAGPLGRVLPSRAAQQDITVGARVAHAIGRLDIGQAVVVKAGQVLGVEAAEGTDALIMRCATLGATDQPGGVLIKAKKPEQERRVDLPAIGVTTVENAHRAGLEGIALEAGSSLIIDRTAVIARANELNLFLLGFTADEEG